MNYRNEVILSGNLAKKFEYQQHYSQVKKSEAILEVKRMSGTVDQVIIQAVGWVTEVAEKFQEGDCVYVNGEIRTYNYHGEDNKIHTKVYVYINRIWKCIPQEHDINEVKMTGVIVKKADIRRTPLARKIQEIIIATKYCNQNGDAYVPTIAWDAMALKVCREYKVGNVIRIIGRYQSRKYTKVYPDGKQEEKTTYEVSIIRLDI